MESTLIVALFFIINLMLVISITSGLMIFFGKIQGDLVSFWILGCSKSKIEKMAMKFVHFLCAGAVLVGLGLGGGFLVLLKRYSGLLMPDVFLERNMPVNITLQGILLSVLIPYLIASLFAYLSFFHFKKDERTFIEQLRS
jgi:lipoprotein-releasing system permease protein